VNTRKTHVAWDPNLIRVEYLDEEGTPYYCSFHTSDTAAATREGSEVDGHLVRSRIAGRLSGARPPFGTHARVTSEELGFSLAWVVPPWLDYRLPRCTMPFSQHQPREHAQARRSETSSEPRCLVNVLQPIPFNTRRFAMTVVTGTVGEEFIIDGRIRIRILAVDREEVRFEVNFPEFLGPDGNGLHGQPDALSRWPAGST
jgi:hypothetical protein